MINLLDRRDPQALIKYREKCREHQERLILEDIKSALEDYKQQPGSILPAGDTPMEVVKLANGSYMASQGNAGFVHPDRDVAMKMMSNHIIGKIDQPGVFDVPKVTEYAKAVIIARDHLEHMNSRDMYSKTVEERAEHMVRTDMAKGALERAEREYKVAW
jgi:hypothetical protein